MAAEQHTPAQLGLFKWAVSQELSSAIPVDCDKIHEYEIGNVIVYKKWLRFFLPWRRHSLEFLRGPNEQPLHLKDLLVPDDRKLLDSVRQNNTAVFSTEKREWEYTKFDPDHLEGVKITAELGNVQEVSSNLFQLLDGRHPRGDLQHPALQSARRRGGILLVISRVYKADKADIQLGKMPGEGTETKEIQWSQVFSSASTTTVGFMLLKLNIGSEGQLRPSPSVGLPSQLLKQVVADSTEVKEEVDAGSVMERHCDYGQRDLHIFESNSFYGIIEEANLYMKPLVMNGEMQKEFLKLISLPHQREVLKKLVEYLSDLLDALLLERDLPPSPPEFEDVVGKLTADPRKRHMEIVALIMASEAFQDFSPSAMKCFVDLTAEQRENILRIIRSIPFGTSAHVFTDPAFSDDDPMFYLILRRMGFGSSAGKLAFSANPDYEGDLVGAGIIAIQATTVL